MWKSLQTDTSEVSYQHSYWATRIIRLLAGGLIIFFFYTWIIFQWYIYMCIHGLNSCNIFWQSFSFISNHRTTRDTCVRDGHIDASTFQAHPNCYNNTNIDYYANENIFYSYRNQEPVLFIHFPILHH